MAKVIEVGDNVSHVKPGQLVVPAWHVACGTCASCVSGRPTGCTNVPRNAMFGLPAGGDYGGFFSEAVRIPFAGYALAPLPEGVSARAAASVGDNFSDTYGAVARTLRNAPGADVLVIGGTGSVGVFAVTFAKALGASSVSYVDAFDPECVELARGLGAEILDEAPPDREFQVTFDASGSPDGLRTALSAVAPNGTCHSFGIYWQDVAVPAYSMCVRRPPGRRRPDRKRDHVVRRRTGRPAQEGPARRFRRRHPEVGVGKDPPQGPQGTPGNRLRRPSIVCSRR
ncbi:alcohol dehydrogenase catalytic domain-containing protein [Streptomyces hyaluromycini]|uniref:alcohol dehydrogenase catalytic domain-containing protein n=1 Tax=Streptomyces hyaluromycini TaxID=1377993 RepID=UPI003D9EA32C